MLNEAISLGKRQLVDSIWKSAGIEGLGTTFPNTEKILENLPVMTTKDEMLFIVNMKRAWDFLFQNIDYPNNIMLIREINKITMDNLIYNPGQLRNIPVSIGGTSWKPDMPNESETVNFLKELNQKSDKLQAALDAFCYFARAQIFLDGNKRVAQLICNKIFMENNIGILSVPYDQIGLFKEKLVRFYETNNPNDLQSFFKSDCISFTSEYRQLLNKESKKESITNELFQAADTLKKQTVDNLSKEKGSEIID